MNWHVLGDVSYQKRNLHTVVDLTSNASYFFFQMAWNIELSNKVVTGAPAGGALALLHRHQV